MKRPLLLALASGLAVCLLAGCRSGSEVHIDVEKTIVTGVGQEFTIALDSNPTTGYDWREVHDESMLSLIEEEYVPGEKAKGLVGAGGTQYYRFQALEAGNTEITFTYQRAWEGTFIQQKIFRVNIRSSSISED